jgi:hypothetical protein
MAGERPAKYRQEIQQVSQCALIAHHRVHLVQRGPSGPSSGKEKLLYGPTPPE